MDISDSAFRYVKEGHQQIILAGSEYGSGSSRDWAAKGPYLLGIKAVQKHPPLFVVVFYFISKNKFYE